MRRNLLKVSVSLVVSTKALISLALVVESSVVIVATVAVRVATDSLSWSVADSRLAMALTVSCW